MSADALWFMVRYPDGRVSGHNTTANWAGTPQRPPQTVREEGPPMSFTHSVYVTAPDYEAAQEAARRAFDAHSEVER